MKDFKNDSTTTLSRFGRDKRTRVATQSAERVERRPYRNDADETGSERSFKPAKRASYNPHFTEDNRPVEERRQTRYGDRGHLSLINITEPTTQLSR